MPLSHQTPAAGIIPGRSPNTFHQGWPLEDQNLEQIREFGISSCTRQSLGRKGETATPLDTAWIGHLLIVQWASEWSCQVQQPYFSCRICLPPSGCGKPQENRVLSMQGVPVQSLVGELRSHMQRGTAKRNNSNNRVFCFFFFFKLEIVMQRFTTLANSEM